MKYLLIISLTLIIIVSCKKEPSKKAFLYGRLIDNCEGTPVANQQLDFYRNFKESNSWLISDTEELFLESTTTNADGYFYFSGEDYTSNGTPYIQGGSVRLPNGTRLVNGNLGEGKNTEFPENSNKNVGDLLLNGMSIDLNFRIADHNGAIYYDSVRVIGLGGDIITLTTPSADYFEQSSITNLMTINYTLASQEGHTQYNFNPIMYFYYNGAMNTKEVGYYYFDQCSTTGNIVFDF